MDIEGDFFCVATVLFVGEAVDVTAVLLHGEGMHARSYALFANLVFILGISDLSIGGC